MPTGCHTITTYSAQARTYFITLDPWNCNIPGRTISSSLSMTYAILSSNIICSVSQHLIDSMNMSTSSPSSSKPSFDRLLFGILRNCVASTARSRINHGKHMASGCLMKTILSLTITTWYQSILSFIWKYILSILYANLMSAKIQWAFSGAQRTCDGHELVSCMAISSGPQVKPLAHSPIKPANQSPCHLKTCACSISHWEENLETKGVKFAKVLLGALQAALLGHQGQPWKRRRLSAINDQPTN